MTCDELRLMGCVKTLQSFKIKQFASITPRKRVQNGLIMTQHTKMTSKLNLKQKTISKNYE